MTVTEAFRAYRDDVIAFRGQSLKTEENHFVVMKALVLYFGDIDILDLQFAMVRDWKLDLDKGRSPETVRNYVIKLRVVLEYLSKRGAAVLDPTLVPVPKRTDKVPTFLTEAQVAQCIKSTKRVKNKAIISLLYASGIRVSELCALNRGSNHEGSFTVVGKGGRARLCFIDPRTDRLVRKYYETREDNNPAVFLSDSGQRITPGAIQDTFKTVRKQTGLQVHPHTLRHSFATNLLRNNTNMRYVQEFLGHRSIATTQMYTHVINLDLQKIYKEKHSI